MGILEDNLAVAMAHTDLTKVPACSLPDGYAIRSYRPGDEGAWVAIHEEADLWNEVDLKRFKEIFSEHPVSLEERQLYLLNAHQEPIGTATAWMRERKGRMRGLVHWVAIRPDYQGKGLAKPLLSETCALLVRLGHTDAFLKSSTARIAAINLYWKFGFRPLFSEIADAETWERLRRHVRED